MGELRYHEELLHWIWENRQLSGHPLLTLSEKEVVIHDIGKRNPTDGPDFISAKITIGKLIWHGDVEIHWRANDWYRHGHQNDVNYSGVILHIIFDNEKQPQLIKPALPTLCLKPFLNKPLSSFFEGFKMEKGLPCSKKLSYISAGALEAQIAKAHRQYFEQKADDLLHFYDPELPPSEAWKNLLIIAFFDGLGISYNRMPMRKLARVLLKDYKNISSLLKLKETALKEAGLEASSNHTEFNWKKKGSRPSNHPKPRIMQGCELLWHITHSPFKNWFNQNIHRTFVRCVKQVKCRPNLGKERSDILFGTVWLPAIYLLGELFGSKKLASSAKTAWCNHRTKLPASVLRPFQHAGLPASIYQQKLGTVYQLRNYCRQRSCHRCEVFKSTISA